jgi:hypothetical protein
MDRTGHDTPARVSRTVARRAALLAAVGLLLTLTACAATGNPEASSTADAGFWLGLWHGLITPITFVISLFTDDVGIYEVDNTGGWYDFGYVIGLSIAFGGPAGGGASASRRRR